MGPPRDRREPAPECRSCFVDPIERGWNVNRPDARFEYHRMRQVDVPQN